MATHRLSIVQIVLWHLTILLLDGYIVGSTFSLTYQKQFMLALTRKILASKLTFRCQFIYMTLTLPIDIKHETIRFTSTYVIASHDFLAP